MNDEATNSIVTIHSVSLNGSTTSNDYEILKQTALPSSLFGEIILVQYFKF